MGNTTRILLTAALAFSSFPALAQDANIRSISRLRIAAGKGGDFTAAIRDWNAMAKKAGSERYSTVWQAVTGPREYVMVSYVPNLAVFDVQQDPKLKDVAGQAAAIGARIGACIESSERIIDDVLPDLSLPRTAEPPKMIRSLRRVVKPESVAAYVELVKAELAPAMKKAGVKTWVTARTRLGGPRNEFRSATGLESWADLDGTAAVIKAMGQDAYNRYIAKVTAMTVESEVNIYRYAPNLSYLPGSAAPPSGN